IPRFEGMAIPRARRVAVLLAVGPLLVLLLGGWTASPRVARGLADAAPSRAAGLATTPRFAEVMGYEPVALPELSGALVSPDGDCSTPTGGTVFGFDDACREHDLAYDVLRYRQAVGLPVDGRDR